MAYTTPVTIVPCCCCCPILWHLARHMDTVSESHVYWRCFCWVTAPLIGQCSPSQQPISWLFLVGSTVYDCLISHMQSQECSPWLGQACRHSRWLRRACSCHAPGQPFSSARERSSSSAQVRHTSVPGGTDKQWSQATMVWMDTHTVYHHLQRGHSVWGTAGREGPTAAW